MAKVDVRSEITGSVWKILVKEGDEVEEDDTLMILESMKMEIALESPVDGVVSKIHVNEDDQIATGDIACVIEE